ncbi:MAG: hypothetical protein ABSE48_17570 [Verrucomicrobiota bacterium]|jgi:hypothetical protein
MKPIVLHTMLVVGTLLLCAGCSTVNPAAEQHSVAATSDNQKPANVRHDYPMSWFVRGWLAGESTPPDFPEPGDNGSYAWMAVGVPFEILGCWLAGSK